MVGKNHAQGSARPDPTDLGACEPLRPLRARHGRPAADRLSDLAAGDRTVGSRPIAAVVSQSIWAFFGAPGAGNSKRHLGHSGCARAYMWARIPSEQAKVEKAIAKHAAL